MRKIALTVWSLIVLCTILSLESVIGAELCLAQTSAISPTTGAGNLGSSVTQVGNTYQITGGTRPGGGPNLFHSLSQFSVGHPDTALFLNTTPQLQTSNILARVTGGNPSSIFGTIDTLSYPSANLFLMNPAGIVFGPNAALNVGGSVVFTSADHIRLGDGARFMAVPSLQDALISAAPVAAFGFLGSNPGNISVEGSHLSLTDGQELSLVAGDVTIGRALVEGSTQRASLSVPGGQIKIASVSSPNEIGHSSLQPAPNVNGESFTTTGTITVSQGSTVDASGNGGGTVLIRGGRFILDESQISASNTGPSVAKIGSGIDIEAAHDVVIKNAALLESNVSENVGSGVGSGEVRVKAESVEIRGILDFKAFPFTGIRSNVRNGADGKSGDVRIEANSIAMKDLGIIETVTEGMGDAGNIILHARDSIRIDTSIIASDSLGSSGNAGHIELSSLQGNIEMINTPLVESQTLNSSGRAGSIVVTAKAGDIVLADQGFLFTAIRGTGGDGGSGQIQLAAKNLYIRNQSIISGDNLSGLKPGDITANLSDTFSISGQSFMQTTSRGQATASDLNITAKEVKITQGSFLSTESFSSGSGGHMNLSTNRFQMTTGAQIRSGTTGSGSGGIVSIQGLAGPATSVTIDGSGSGVFTNTNGSGIGGTINLSTQSLTLQNGGTLSASTSGVEPTATGGTISVLANQSVTLNNGGSITASSTGPANAGNIAINAGAQFLSQNGSITTEASQASGGNILIQATDAIRLVNSQLSTSVQGGPNTSGGNITLDPAIVTLQNSQVLAQAVQGAGGNINIIAGTFLADQTSVVSASSQFGLSGAVNIQSPVSSLSGSLATLPQRPLQAQNLLRQRCAAQANGQLSSLVVSGRDTLPTEPGGWLMSSMALLSEEIPTSQSNPLTSDKLLPSRQKMIVSGQLYEQPTSSPQQGLTSWAVGCGS